MLNGYWPVVVGVMVEFFIGCYALIALQNYRQFYATIGRKPRRSIIIGYRCVIGLALTCALLMLALPWIEEILT